MSSYEKVRGGKIIFKGDSKKKSIKRKIDENAEEKFKARIAGDDSKEDDAEEFEIKILPGTGRISSSGTVIMGHFTEFMNQLKPGDAIIITHPTSLQEETKIVRMVLSNTSMGISSAFSTDLISTTSFRYIKAPKDETTEVSKEESEKHKKHKTEEDAFGTYASKGGKEFVYRERKAGAFGGYRIIKETNTGDKSREDLLNMRSKKKADRFVVHF